ncbi:GntR family transcriptional regulator [Bacteroidia bacterium]|nr:GntR family transcriptional regulator [Bacteroidia bacterium]
MKPTKKLTIQKVEIKRPEDAIMMQIKRLIKSGELKSGDTLPSERKLAEMFGVGRTVVRDAIKKLEFYGVLRSKPQSGIEVVSKSAKVLKHVLDSVFDMEDFDFYSLVEARVLLEMKAANLAAERRTKEDLKSLKKAVDDYIKKTKLGEDAVEEDFAIHKQITMCSGNSVITSLLEIIIPDILFHYRKYELCVTNYEKSVKEHIELYESIKKQDAANAAKCMKKHLDNIVMFAAKQKNVKNEI